MSPCHRFPWGLSRRAGQGWRSLGLGVLVVVLFASPVVGQTLRDLLTVPGLNPRRFAAYFEDFAYEFSGPVQPAEAFLAQRAGDCDDYAVLADYVLSRRALTTRLIHIRFIGRVNHAVCYIAESKGYLDYNNRIYHFPLERSGPRLRDIADRVADSLSANWTSASEWTYSYDEGRKHFVATVVKTDPPETDPDNPRRLARDNPSSP